MDFVMLRDGLSFKAAALSLGAWDDSGDSARARAELAAKRAENERLNKTAEALDSTERQLRIETRTKLHRWEQIRRQAGQRLSKLTNGSAEAERCWATMVLALDEIRQAAVTYGLLSFGSTDERTRFVLRTDQRSEIISVLLTAGFLRDDSGHITEVLCAE